MLPKIDAAYQRLQDLSITQPRFETWNLLLKALLIWATLTALNLFFHVFHNVWNLLTDGAMSALHLMQPSYPDRSQFTNESAYNEAYERYEKKGKKLRQAVWVAFAVGVPLRALPGFFDWVIRVFIFIALTLPFAEQIAISIGSQIQLVEVFESAAHFNFGEAISKLRLMIGLVSAGSGGS